MDSIGRSAEELRKVLKPMVAMFVAEIAPKKDSITISRAYSEYGRRWVNMQRERGNLSVRETPTGRIMVSRVDLECLKAAESEAPRAIFK